MAPRLNRSAQHCEHEDKLDEDLRAELPLKRIWTVASAEEEEKE